MYWFASTKALFTRHLNYVIIIDSGEHQYIYWYMSRWRLIYFSLDVSFVVRYMYYVFVWIVILHPSSNQILSQLLKLLCFCKLYTYWIHPYNYVLVHLLNLQIYSRRLHLDTKALIHLYCLLNRPCSMYSPFCWIIHGAWSV